MAKQKALQVDPETHLKLKRAAAEGQTIGQLVKELVDRFLPKVTKPS